MAPSVLPIVVDNASTDDTLARVETHPEARVISNHENRGFAAGANQGEKAAAGADLILLLNPDTELSTGIEPLVDAAREQGLAAGQLTNEHGEAQTGFTIRRLPTTGTLIFELLGVNRLWPGNPVNRRYRYLGRDLDQPGPVEQPAGAFLMVRRDVWQRLGGLDESFRPVWFEDVDFCQRAHAAGYRIQYVPSVKAVHGGAHSVSQLASGPRAVYWCVSLLKYAAKHFSSGEYRAICLAMLLGSLPRMVAGMIRERSLSSAAYLKIIRFASKGVVSPRILQHGTGTIH